MNDADRGSMVKKGHRSDVSFGSIVSKTAVRAWRGSSEFRVGGRAGRDSSINSTDF